MLQTEVKSRDEVINERIAASSLAVKVALEANNKRLDSMNEVRGTLADQAGRMITRTESDAERAVMSARYDTELTTIRDKLESSTRPNYVLAGASLSVLVAIISGMWLVIGLKIDTSIAPIVLAVEQVKTIQAAHERSLVDLDTVVRTVDTQAKLTNAVAAQNTVDIKRQWDAMRSQDAQLPLITSERSAQISAVSAEVIRLSIWADLFRGKLFPGTRDSARPATIPVSPR